MVDKVQTVPRDKIGKTIGRLDAVILLAVEDALAVFLGSAISGLEPAHLRNG
jgi:hypothetical protein